MNVFIKYIIDGLSFNTIRLWSEKFCKMFSKRTLNTAMNSKQLPPKGKTICSPKFVLSNIQYISNFG